MSLGGGAAETSVVMGVLRNAELTSEDAACQLRMMLYPSNRCRFCDDGVAAWVSKVALLIRICRAKPFQLKGGFKLVFGDAEGDGLFEIVHLVLDDVAVLLPCKLVLVDWDCYAERSLCPRPACNNQFVPPVWLKS